jgi:hypothetical protein
LPLNSYGDGRNQEAPKGEEKGCDVVWGGGSSPGWEAIAIRRATREWKRLRKGCGGQRWRKSKGIATVELPDEGVATAEVHGYEAHGVGQREMKIKRFLE